ncbi:MAG: NADH-quinone oxidoreductase subunit NuoH [Gammaproteobacteria bacterium]|jgi:NADH-quinone oxidoreductase subunit H|nr:NADH-quinone oxidoreductase subunit NuoH [Gammaproteobacteria bacterium]
MHTALIQLINVVAILLFVVFGAALLTWVERRLLGIWQDRYGPNRVGPLGSLQIVADMIKLLMKQDWVPPFADRLVFIVAPAIAMFVVVAAFAVIPMAPGIGVIDLNIGLLFFLAMTSLGVYAVMFGAYASDNKYALLGGLRAAAQMVSYEVFMGLSLMGVVMLAGSFNLRELVLAQADGWFIVPQFVGFMIFFVAGIAESHRTPFDLPEAEHELTAGFHTEYSGMKFAMFFLGEYVSVLMTAAMITVLFLGGWLGPAWLPPLFWFLLKTTLLVLSMILIRGALPRPRYDQLMAFGWKVMLPLALINLLATGALKLM